MYNIAKPYTYIKEQTNYEKNYRNKTENAFQPQDDKYELF